MSHYAKLPPPPRERCTYTHVPIQIPIPSTSNQITLAANLYLPTFPNSEKTSLGTIPLLVPHGRGIEATLSHSTVFAARGYTVLFVSCGGTFGSTGTWDPFRTESSDGKAIVEWMREQEWCIGSFAMHGMRCLAYSAFAMMGSDGMEDIEAAVLSVPLFDVGEFVWGTGAMNMGFLVWAEMARGMEGRWGGVMGRGDGEG
ncbi:X-Pro dipeptidyl-peptidase-domain-containing protein [Immersiella caudata]|uniref:X-Pro dipeptidyl-peptidase-domain-containing protein n=1 Tax=Immersiella caudata TaxID=314043 RepID=A0AA39XCU2_9PEZI|nr:X-Pro dipeptidyl-peptidase-domain-containing protein [Immersiella caudata]